MNYKEFVQRAVIAWIPQMCWPVTVDSPLGGDVILAATQAADLLVEEGLLDPPVSSVTIKRGEPVIDFFPDEVFGDKRAPLMDGFYIEREGHAIAWRPTEDEAYIDTQVGEGWGKMESITMCKMFQDFIPLREQYYAEKA